MFIDALLTGRFGGDASGVDLNKELSSIFEGCSDFLRMSKYLIWLSCLNSLWMVATPNPDEGLIPRVLDEGKYFCWTWVCNSMFVLFG